MEIDISGLSKEDVLAALYNAARPKGLGFLKYNPRPITAEEAKEIIIVGDDHRRALGSMGPEYYEEYCFEFVNGRAIHVELTYDTVAVYKYDRLNGEGIAQRAIQYLRDTGEVCCQELLDIQYKKVLEDTLDVLDNIDSGMRINFLGKEYELGFAQHSEQLREAIKTAVKDLPE